MDETAYNASKAYADQLLVCVDKTECYIQDRANAGEAYPDLFLHPLMELRLLKLANPTLTRTYNKKEDWSEEYGESVDEDTFYKQAKARERYNRRRLQERERKAMESRHWSSIDPHFFMESGEYYPVAGKRIQRKRKEYYWDAEQEMYVKIDWTEDTEAADGPS